MSALKANNLVPANPNYSWEDLYGIDGGALTNLTRTNFFVLPLGPVALCFYTGSGAITISELENLPYGSVVFCTGLAAPAVYVHKAASTWKYTAINT
jgi:hypothetical protein